MEEVKKFLSSAGLRPADIPTALVIHEVLGVSVLLSAWAACWAVKPSRNLLNALQVRKLPEWQKAQENVNKSKLINFVRNSKYLSSRRGAELGVAFGESYFLRKLCMPVLIPLKLWMTYQLVGWARGEQEKGAETGH
eukprot:GFUD01089070.1.p1 GENE.GFUD01089070.1~~GFUD01089070.1.p1  ORF type:complete len:137 (+),score=43.26 GFUD01089070.1:88-498(+)